MFRGKIFLVLIILLILPSYVSLHTQKSMGLPILCYSFRLATTVNFFALINESAFH